MTKNEVWPEELPEALSGGKARFMVHDSFTPIPVRDADVYWLRYILHDWDDASCIEILSNLQINEPAVSYFDLRADHGDDYKERGASDWPVSASELPSSQEI
ncbi:O-methyltransferase [Penicillium longicatenatum]|nr:O-methyltransferase [Penicillium longicatenatum]